MNYKNWFFCRIIVLLAVFYFISPVLCFAWGERTLTDNSKRYTPPVIYSNHNFENEMGIENPSLQDLGNIIDKGIKYSDAGLLAKAAIILGYEEKQWNVKSSLIKAEDLIKEAQKIAMFRKNKEVLKTIIDAYNEPSLSVYNPGAAVELQAFLDKTGSSRANTSNTGTIIVYNNSRKANILIYINDIYMGTVPKGGIRKLNNVSSGRISMRANDGFCLQWGPRRVFLGRNDVFHWKLY